MRRRHRRRMAVTVAAVMWTSCLTPPAAALAGAPDLRLAAGRWIAYGVLLLSLVLLSFIDLRTRVLPDALTLGALVSGLAFSSLGCTVPLATAATGAAVGGGVGTLIVLATRGRMGMGDAKLLAAIGSYLGPYGAVGALFWGSLAGSVTGLVLVLTKRIGLDTPIPFGPFLAAGTVLAGLTVPGWLRGLGL